MLRTENYATMVDIPHYAKRNSSFYINCLDFNLSTPSIIIAQYTLTAIDESQFLDYGTYVNR